MPVYNMVNAELGFGFRWEPESRNLYMVRLSDSSDHEQIASNIMSPEAAKALALMWCQGYKSRARELNRAPGKRHLHMFAERGLFGVQPKNIKPVNVGETKPGDAS